ncbi:hypothetical protein K435DRAFT_863149 [Dendrothele bispora CBS 962.96]|uniref:Chromatin modification-related protein n=1 Tax=Dendrothele bispora (strain CBS 962.96) TaxID=1314807 RepID=A0A4S8LRT3_DENBC|nr:hypothetical protein K435DRAFT_863149 [Dendrothele bispora CBS 962.96]
MSAAAIAQNVEDAANLATEFIYSLDNVPAEVKHYLEEIKYKDTKAQELQQQIDSDSSRWIKHSLKATGFTFSTSRSLSPSPSSSPAPHSNPNSSSNAPLPSSQIPNKIAQSYAEIEQLTHEKIALAQRIIDLMTRTCAKLDIDLHKVRVLSGEIGEGTAAGSNSSLPLTPGLSASASGLGFGLGVGAGASLGGVAVNASGGSVSGWTGNGEGAGLVDIPMTPLSGTGRRQSAMNAAAAMSASLAGGSNSPGGPPNKKRRVNSSASTPSIKLPAPNHSRSGSPAFSSISTHNKSSANTRSRLSRQIHPPPAAAAAASSSSSTRGGRNAKADPHGDEDAEGDEDADGDADADADDDPDMDGGDAEMEGEGDDDDEGDDDSLYCVCQRKSFGDMIACDNEGGCPYEWFHLTCVGLSKPLPDVWYCEVCEPKFRGAGGGTVGNGGTGGGATVNANVSSGGGSSGGSGGAQTSNKASSARKGRKK